MPDNEPLTDSGVTSASRATPGRQIAVRELQPGDQLVNERYLARRCTVETVTAELDRDLQPWWAVRLVGGGIIAVDSLDDTLALAAPRTDTPAPSSDRPPDPFDPPPRMRKLLELAHHHRRNYIVTHGTATSGEPFVRVRIAWMPAGCETRTDVELTWHTFDTGTYRLFHAAAHGCRRPHHTITLSTARRLVSGEVCFHRDRSQD
ncbi:hypothetical protein [Nocardia farcinica]